VIVVRDALQHRRDALEARPVSTDGFGSGTRVPSVCRSNCMNTRFQISRKRPASAPSTKASCENSVRDGVGPLAARARREGEVLRHVREVDVDLGARAAGAGVGHLPEVVLLAETVDATRRDAGLLHPELPRLVVVLVDGDADVLGGDARSLVTNSQAKRIASRLK
jgi:hypothetical protein